ncbi:uronate isomerase [Dictyobacter sp. S3.2.2.5]|uniref:Uronate isomerase n=1 Tax=Dictyobacter halimunensis TaxID=3026934 RepID=A0ABQ6FZT1_9CHLR|nr:uronate isomerase [Dictyobacter sp. S3.2.2.5]
MAQTRDDRYFASDPTQRQMARTLYAQVKDLPLICPHGHVDPRLLSAEHYNWGSPVDLLIIPDHYVFRMLYSQGIPLEALGIPRRDGGATEKDHRKIWQVVCDYWYLFRGTPTSLWLRDELRDIFGIEQQMTPANAQTIYDALTERLQQPEFQPRRLFERFKIEVLATTDAATSRLEEHQKLRDSDWHGRVIPTFRPDAVVNIQPGFAEQIRLLSEVSDIDVSDYRTYLTALEQRRRFFRELGATATDHAAQSAYTARLSAHEAEAIFQRALKDEASAEDARRFTGHMLIEMARMSVEDGLVMQVHIGSSRDHNPDLLARFGRDMGADIPTSSEFTHNFKPLLDLFGSDPRLSLIVFNLDETTYSRELAPLAGHYPALRLGPPWWFFDSVLGMRRYFDTTVETAGIYNTAGFNDDTRAYPSIPARHDVWRRVSSDWLARQVVEDIIDEEDANEMIVDLAYRLAKQSYKLEG